MKRFLSRVIPILIVLAILGYLVSQVATRENWRQVQAYLSKASGEWVVVSFLLLLITLALDVVIWAQALRMFQSPVGFRASARIWFPALIARYLPGKVASLALRIWLSEREGISPYRAGGAAFFEVVLRIMAALIVFGLSIPFWPIVSGMAQLTALLIIVPVGLVALHPRLLQWALNLALKVLKRPAALVPFRFRDVLLLLALLCGRWALYGIAFSQFAAAIAPQLWASVPAVIGMASLSWAAGFLFVLAPAGLGVNEGVLTWGLIQLLAPGADSGDPAVIAAALALLGRLWAVAGEVSWLAAVPLMRGGSKQRAGSG